MTKEEWEQVEKEMFPPYGHVKLKIDGYDVSLGFVEVVGFRWEIAVCVNGKIRFEDLQTDCEIRRRFYQKHTRSIMPKDKKDKLLKGMKKAEREKFEQENYNMMYYDYYMPTWASFKKLKAHLIKNNTNIEWIKGE